MGRMVGQERFGALWRAGWPGWETVEAAALARAPSGGWVDLGERRPASIVVGKTGWLPLPTEDPEGGPRRFGDRRAALRRWCRENLEGEWCLIHGPGFIEVHFQRLSDAALFRVTFC